VAIVIDVLRASTTIATALANGASHVIPLDTVEAARDRQARQPELLLCGERDAHPLPGFDLGNSPREYTRERVEGKGLILTTTNGTKALQAAEKAGAGTIVVGALTNRQAVVDFSAGSLNPLLLVCAGCQGQFSLEDALCAGALIAGLGAELLLTDAARACLALYEYWGPDQLALAVAGSEHGQRLQRKGYGEDIMLAMAVDTCPVVPIYQDGEIRLWRTEQEMDR
jgi:2-phosphosulfolactate phosphatase